MIKKVTENKQKVIAKGILKSIDEEGLHIADSPDTEETECLEILYLLELFGGKAISLSITEQNKDEEEI